MNSPTPEQVRQLRESASLSRHRFGRLVYSTARAVESWENGQRGMHPGLFELARIKIAEAAIQGECGPPQGSHHSGDSAES